MKVSKEELLHIANLADLKIKDDEIDNYLANLQDILNFAEVVNKAPIDNLQETIGANEICFPCPLPPYFWSPYILCCLLES